MSVVYFSIDTTSLDVSGAELCAIGATTTQGWNFYQCIKPNIQINQEAFAVHGIQVHHGNLYKNGQIIHDAMEPYKGIRTFINWLHFVNCKFLVAHFNHGFHAPILLNNMKRYQAKIPRRIRLADSMKFMTKYFPETRTDLKLTNCLQKICQKPLKQPMDAFTKADACRMICEEGAERTFKRFLNIQLHWDRNRNFPLLPSFETLNKVK